ncbi:MAG: hypothetical protein JNL60_13280 [Bacteroidia bacterium]|nr:hypothetical protein [Bacteroidia bacterium]
MDPMLNTNNEEQQASLNSNSNGSEKSELMQFFEDRVNDAYWAYRDLLKEILDGDVKGTA